MRASISHTAGRPGPGGPRASSASRRFLHLAAGLSSSRPRDRRIFDGSGPRRIHAPRPVCRKRPLLLRAGIDPQSNRARARVSFLRQLGGGRDRKVNDSSNAGETISRGRGPSTAKYRNRRTPERNVHASGPMAPLR